MNYQDEDTRAQGHDRTRPQPTPCTNTSGRGPVCEAAVPAASAACTSSVPLPALHCVSRVDSPIIAAFSAGAAAVMDRHAAAASSASGAVVLIKLEPPNTSAGRSASESGSPDPAVELIDDSSDADLVTVWDATSPAIGAAMPVSVSAAAPFTLAVARERAHDANDALLTSDIRGGRAAAIAAAEGGAGGAGGAHSGGRSQKVKPVFTVGVYPCRATQK